MEVMLCSHCIYQMHMISICHITDDVPFEHLIGVGVCQASLL